MSTPLRRYQRLGKLFAYEVFEGWYQPAVDGSRNQWGTSVDAQTARAGSLTIAAGHILAHGSRWGADARWGTSLTSRAVGQWR